MNKPSFLVVGAAKSGTTSLDGYLKQHPDIFLPGIKESRYFSNVVDKNINPFTNQEHVNIISSPKKYYDLFKNSTAKAIGDISPDYLYYYEESIKKIKNELGEDTKIIIILRNPIERAYSNYLHLRRDDLTEKSFQEVINMESTWGSNIWYGFKNISSGYYYDAVKSYIDNFKNVKVILFEEFIKNPEECISDITKFIEIDEYFKYKKPGFTNKTGIPKSKFLNNISKGKIPLKTIIKPIVFKIFSRNKIQSILQNIRNNNLNKPKLEESIKIQLIKIYSNDIEKLEKLLNKDLSIWK